MRRRMIILSIAVAILALIILAPITVVTWEYTNSDAFCTNACHQVHPEESKSHKLVSRHREVACVECHIGRMGFFDSLWDKVGHTSHAWALLVGYERPTHSKSMQTAEKSCVNCHAADPHRKNALSINEQFAEDKRNSSDTTLMVMRLAGRQFGREKRLGVDWHNSGVISYWTSHPEREEVQKVVAKMPDGTQRTYHNIRAAELTDNNELVERKLDCLSCHNRVGHPFYGPDTNLDRLLANGTLPREAPFLKKELMDLYRQYTDSAASERTAEELRNDVQQSLSQYSPDSGTGGSASQKFSPEQLKQIEELVVAWLQSAQNLRANDLSWKAFPSHTGHTDSPGCFRCHNGRLQTEDKQVIPVNCTTCHSIPLVIRGRSIPPYYLEQMDLRKPRDHRDPAYLATHMDQDTESCDRCHGAVEYGTDDESHCSNSGCHDREWKYLDLEAIRTTMPLQDAAQ